MNEMAVMEIEFCSCCGEELSDFLTGTPELCLCCFDRLQENCTRNPAYMAQKIGEQLRENLILKGEKMASKGNSKCECGSGHKFKHCCGKNKAERSAPAEEAPQEEAAEVEEPTEEEEPPVEATNEAENTEDRGSDE